MIVYFVEIKEVGSVIRVSYKAPPADASAAEIRVAAKFSSLMKKLTKQLNGKVIMQSTPIELEGN